ncbi:FAD-binding oxidoreductase [Microvirga sp. 0TCS3.31]
MTVLDISAADALAGDLAGDVITPGHPAYDDQRRIWNGEIDRRPAVLARCQGASDVATALRWARDRGLPVAVRGGGHGIAGHSLVDDGVVLDLSAMRGAVVDPTSRTVAAQGGALNAHVDREGQVFGLAMTSGYISHTGIAGLTLGGGIGHLMRTMGLAIDALRSCQVVVADGSVVRASETENPDLFWGLRGGGGNFGVVTDFTFELQPLGPTILAGLVAWPADEAPTVLAFLRDFMADAPDEVGLMANLRLAPALPMFPEHLHGRPIIGLVATYAGPVEEGERVLAPVRALGHPVLDTIAPKPYVAHQKFLDPAVPHGRHYYWKSHRLGPLTGDVIDTICEHLATISSPLSTVPIFCFGGAMSRVAEDATAFPHRDASHDINIVASWLPERAGDADRHRAWVRGFFDALAPHSRGVYVNFTSDDAQTRVQEAYSPLQWERLRTLKTAWDPDNVFRGNANIPPLA